MSKNNKIPVTGTISVTEHSTITPITRAPIPTVDSTVWGTAPLSQLLEDRSVLTSRLFALDGMGNTSLLAMQQSLQDSIDLLDYIISERFDSSEHT